MEAGALNEDQLVPDANGVLDQSNNGWKHLDEKLWKTGKSLLFLNLSHNSLVEISPLIASLKLLRELDLSHNRIQSLPTEIGQCVQLKKLIVHHNSLTCLPSSLRHCRMLVEIDASNNSLENLPTELKALQSLVTLDVQNNSLQSIPETLCECSSLTTLAVDGNESLDSVPSELRRSTKLVLWVCRTTLSHTTELQTLTDINTKLEHNARVANEEKLGLKDEVLRLEGIKQHLEEERPENYLKVKNGCKKAAKDAFVSCTRLACVIS